MLSLGNAFNKDDLINFEKKILNFLNLKKNQKIDYSTEPKIDGISASLFYKKGYLHRDYQEVMVFKVRILLKI